MVQADLGDQQGQADQLDQVNRYHLHLRSLLQTLEAQIIHVLLLGRYHQQIQKHQGYLCLPVILAVLSDLVNQSDQQCLLFQLGQAIPVVLSLQQHQFHLCLRLNLEAQERLK